MNLLVDPARRDKLNRLGGEHLSWENLVDSRGFVPLYRQARALMDRMYDLGKPLACFALRLEPRSASDWPESLVEGGRDFTLQALRQRLRSFPRGEPQVAPAVMEGAGDLLFLLLPGRGAASHGSDVAELLEAVASTPWPVAEGFIPRRIVAGMAFWSPAMVSHDPMVLLGSAFQALVLASCGGDSPLPDTVHVLPEDELHFSALLWEGPRRAPGTAPITAPTQIRRASPASRLPAEIVQAREALRAAPDDPTLWLALAEACEAAGLQEQAFVARAQARRHAVADGPPAEASVATPPAPTQESRGSGSGQVMVSRKDRMKRANKPRTSH